MLTFLFLITVVCILPGVLFSLCAGKYINFKRMVIISLLTGTGGILWEQKAYGTVWITDSSNSLGIYLINIPVEQYGFLFFAPVLMISVYSIIISTGPLYFLRLKINNKISFMIMTMFWALAISAGFIVQIGIISTITAIFVLIVLFMHLTEYLYFKQKININNKVSAFLYIIHSGIFAVKELRKSVG